MVREWILRSLKRNFAESARWIMGGIYAAMVFGYYNDGPDRIPFFLVFAASVLLLAGAFSLIDAALDPDQPGDPFGIFNSEEPD